MADTGAGFLDQEWQHTTRSVGGVLSAIFRRMYPQNMAKRVETAFDCDRSAAVNFTKGHVSERMITKALQAGDWPVILQLGEAITGRSYDQYLQSVVQEHERARERAAARQDHVRSLEARAAELVRLRAGPMDGPKGRAADAVGAREA